MDIGKTTSPSPLFSLTPEQSFSDAAACESSTITAQDQASHEMPEHQRIEERRAVTARPETVHLRHYSFAKGLTQTDPSYSGTGITGEERFRRSRYKEIWLDRTYFGTEKYKKEPLLPGNEYYAEVELSKLYNMDEDSDGIVAQTERDVREGKTEYSRVDQKAKVTLIEKRVKDAGYQGCLVPSNNAAFMFYKVDVTPVNEKRIHPFH
ncbi:hypothetical protein [Endozoicomonas euniceicola]|uniref:Uncharacterized protein n=1 Tax=Endozoicomonas euniceicola TaxID=1234143 RepID=A0ABY6GV02_9GAMM|nr:hypothetical protein [Endozoicomonas euniceicola]UYM16597.1 hypothetical protein NX720_01305 [Endozoicomonas euniceicola]